MHALERHSRAESRSVRACIRSAGRRHRKLPGSDFSLCARRSSMQGRNLLDTLLLHTTAAAAVRMHQDLQQNIVIIKTSWYTHLRIAGKIRLAAICNVLTLQPANFHLANPLYPHTTQHIGPSLDDARTPDDPTTSGDAKKTSNSQCVHTAPGIYVYASWRP